jgi:mono/diheme cytochrome c family protein
MMRPRTLAFAAAAGLSAAAVGAAVSQTAPRVPEGHVATAPQFLVAPLAAGASDQVRQGRDLVILGDCVACHTPGGRPPFSGGRAVNTPFGAIYSANLTSDPQTGIGNWTPDQFWRAMHEGKGARGEHLYPAFPYPWFTKVSRADSDAMLAYLKTVPAVNAAPPANRLIPPLGFRPVMGVWNALFFKPSAWTPDNGRSAEWNRGSYIVNSLGHCGACHTPKNLLGADKKNADFQGGVLDHWLAYDLTGEPRYGLGGWSKTDIVEYLKTGRNSRANSTGAMAEVVSDSTSLMSDGDLNAVAEYLKSLPAGATAGVPAADGKAMRAGQAIFEDACTGCHKEGGVGQPGFFPPLKGSAGLQSPDANNTVRVILTGARTAPTPTRPTPLSMPSFAWKLSDEQIADVATYVRNAWGNRAAPVDPGQVTKLRRALKPVGPREQR